MSGSNYCWGLMMGQINFSGQKILVTGASGFIGNHLCAHLTKNGGEVHAVSRKKRGNESGLSWWQGDLSEIATVRELLMAVKPDVIFHLASHVVGTRDLEVVLPTFRSNLASTVNLLTVASEIGCRRIVLMGSLEEPDVADQQAVPCSPYAAAKWAASAYARMFHSLYQLPVVIMRVFMVYGPAQQDLRKLIPYVILSLLRGKTPELTSGQRPVDWIYVGDVIEGLVAAALASEIEGRTIDIGSGELVPIRTVVEHLLRVCDSQIEPVFGALPERPLEQVRRANTASTHASIGWKPSTSLNEGLKRTVHWYEERFRQNRL